MAPGQGGPYIPAPADTGDAGIIIETGSHRNLVQGSTLYRTGDAVLYVDDADAQRGLRFDGRIAEDFKLLSGVWVSAGQLRVEALAAAAPLLQDAVVTGESNPPKRRGCFFYGCLSLAALGLLALVLGVVGFLVVKNNGRPVDQRLHRDHGGLV
ncbi:MAG: hypothetical protein HC788_07790, partial [Sphingopyxis sp.]|nr:hypothetical protein [Sphingopyxis sp.]